MTEQELLNKIKESAKQTDIPDSLTPRQVAKRLNSLKRPHRTFCFPIQKTVSAAVVVLLTAILSTSAWNTGLPVPKTDKHETVLEPQTETEAITDGTDGGAQTSETPAAETKKNAGTLYTVAKSYGQVYQAIQASYQTESGYRTEGSADMDKGAEIAEAESAKEASRDFSESVVDTSGSTAKLGYSTTNLQTQGVDESDQTKTDGRYIYTVTGTKLKITDTEGGSLEPAGFIAPDLSASDQILEFYIDKNHLFLLVQHYDTTITEETTCYPVESSSKMISLESCDKINTLASAASTILYTYDITDPAHPALTGTVKQDGHYYTSRKIGTIIYLFTQQGLDSKDKNGFVPCAAGEKIPYGNIYIPKEGNEGLIISSIHTTEPDKMIDKVMLVHNSVQIYVADDALYLYNTDYQADTVLTQIAKFSIQDGIINAVNAASVQGEITDTFSIHASQGRLRVLTTCRSSQGGTDNRLYLLDQDLQLTGSLEGIARGEEIYAARYFGNTAYFITYKNTDPLFAADLTDPANPVLLGELKISGFSEYLHFWGNDKLLGIGYETDPQSGEYKGLKLVMFDISDPADLKMVDSTVLKNASNSPALYDYKCVLADPGKNLIGFPAEYSPRGGNYYAQYHVFSFTNGQFTSQLNAQLPDFELISYDSMRGLYIDDTFYLTCPLEITSYNMADGFAKSGHLDLTEPAHQQE